MVDRLRAMRKESGFTLLELLVVVAIIAILATLILANLNRARQQANDAKVQSEVKSISDAVELYLADPSADLTNMQYTGPISKSSPATVLSPLKSTTNGAALLATFPSHPLSTKTYVFTGVGGTGAYNYAVCGDFVSKAGYFYIKNGVSNTATAGNCPTTSAALLALP